jgi:hypothetical protein
MAWITEEFHAVAPGQKHSYSLHLTSDAATTSPSRRQQQLLRARVTLWSPVGSWTL